MSVLGVVNSDRVSEREITDVSKMVEEDIFVSSNYWDTFHNADQMIEKDCDYIILFYDPKEDESHRLLRLCVASKTPFFCVIVTKEKQESKENEKIKTPKRKSIISRFKKKKM